MEGPHARAPNVFARLMTDKAVPAYKVDEGYSEETRSQEDMETSARMFGDNGPSLAGRMPLGSSLHDAVLALSETERRGEQVSMNAGQLVPHAELDDRIRLQHPTKSTSFLNSHSRRSTVAPLSQRPGGAFSSRNHVLDILLSRA